MSATPDSNNNPNHMPLDKSILSATEIFQEGIRSNDLDAAIKSLEPYIHNSLWHALMHTLFVMALAGSSMEQPDIDKAAKAVEDFAKMTNKYRKHGLLISAMKMIKTPNYQKYTDLEVHAELLHTYYILMSTVVCAMETHNIYGLIKVVYRLQKFIKNFKGCRVILKKRKQWDNDVTKLNFEAAVRLTNGLKHLAISHIPPKILKIVNFLGYRGKESIGWEEINKTAFQLPGVGSELARAFLVGYWLVGLPHGGLGPRNLDVCEKIMNKELKNYPNSLILLAAKAKFEEINGRIDTAIEMYNVLTETKILGAHRAVYFQLMFLYALKCDWTQAIKCAQLVRREAAIHSPTVTTYCEAIFLFIKSRQTNDPELKRQASELMKIIPSLRIRHLGKTFTPEKIAVENSLKYFKNNEFLILPEMDILWQGNWMVFIKGNEPMLYKLMERVDQEVNHFKDEIIGSDYLDNYLSAIFYKGCLLKYLGNYKGAKDCFNAILKDESRFGSEYSIPVQAVLELGLCELEQGNHDLAKKWLNKAVNDYSGYLNENCVHVRAFAGLREMGISTDKDKEDETKLDSYKKQWLKDINVEEKSYDTLVQTEEVVVN